MDLKTSQSQYVISLDAIDLSYIATVNKYKSHGVTQIWTKPNLTQRDNEYYEFEIKEEFENEVDENSHSKYTQIPCYICNINVPKIFFKDHLNSKKHNTFQKIINESLDRMKKVISNEVVNENKKVNESTYFCASCVAVVKTNEKISHENSLGHRNSLAVDKILSDFHELYTENKEFGNEGIEERKIFHSKKSKEMAKIEEQKAELPEMKNELLKYVKILNKSNHFKDIKLLDCRNLELKTNSGSKVQIPEEHFHSIIFDHTRNEYYCMLCATTFKIINKWDHLYEKGHVEQITIPFENEHCLRKIDASWTHCAICNTKVHIQHQLEHKSDVIHKLYLNTVLHLYNKYICLETQKGIDFEGNIQTRTNDSNTRLHNDDPDAKNISNSEIYINKTLKRKNSETSENNGNNTLCEQITSREINELTYTNNTSQKQNVKISKEKQTAALLPVTNVNSKSPLVTKDNKKQETLISLSNEVVLKREGTHIKGHSFYCAICKMYIPNHNYNIYVHLTSASHMKKANELGKEELTHVHYNMDLTKFPQLECLLCKKTLPLNNNSITGHILGSTHKRNHKLMLSDNKLIEIQKNEYYCNICQLPIGPMYELVHCQIMKHLENLKPLTDDNSNVATDTSSTSSCNIIGEDLKLRTYLLKNVNHIHRLCLLCNAKVPNNTNNIKSHLTGRLHKSQYKITLESNKIRPEGKNFKCELCNVIVHTGNEIHHLKTNTHCAKKKN